MKKTISLFLALTFVLSLSVTAFAADLPSKTTTDLTKFDVTAENMPEDAEVLLMPINEETASESVPDYKERVEACEAELQKLTEAESIVEYFGEVSDSEGKAVDIREILGLKPEEEPVVSEFCPVIASGFKEEYGKVTASMLFPTPYEEGQKVVVMIGIVTILEDGTQSIVWTAFEGIGTAAVKDAEETYGCIKVEFPPEIASAIQNETALMAVISK